MLSLISKRSTSRGWMLLAILGVGLGLSLTGGTKRSFAQSGTGPIHAFTAHRAGAGLPDVHAAAFEFTRISYFDGGTFCENQKNVGTNFSNIVPSGLSPNNVFASSCGLDLSTVPNARRALNNFQTIFTLTNN